MKSTLRRAPQFSLTGGVLCLDFVNTLDDRPSDHTKELLESYADLARFGEETGAITRAHADRLVERGEAAPGPAKSALHEARGLREAMYSVFAAIVAKKPAPLAELAAVTQYAQEATKHSRLVESKGNFEWRFEPSFDFDSVLWPIVRSAVELLASDKLAYIHGCESKTCQWFFLDTSKNHRRRWCDMKLCGNRAKARKYYATHTD